MIWTKLISGVVLTIATSIALAQDECVPFNPDDTKIVDRGPVKTVVGPLAKFNPCHASVRLDAPSFFALKRGDKPPLVIIAHGGGGLGGYERDFAKLMNQQGYATLIFDAFQMNGLTPFSDLLLFHTSNGGRQRMIYKATLGAYQWVLKSDKVDTTKIFFQGLSNGAAVSINMAGAVDPANVRGVIAEGGPSAGIGFPDEIKVPLLLLYGGADNYGGLHKDDLMHLRAMPCSYNDFYPVAPVGFSQNCSRAANQNESMLSPQGWFESIKAKGAAIRLELIYGGGHGMMFAEFTSSSRQLPGGRMFFISHGATADTRAKLQKLVLEFIESKL
jgi:dienelactone hydrolase